MGLWWYFLVWWGFFVYLGFVCVWVGVFFSRSFRDFGKDIKEGLYGLKTFHWSIYVHPVRSQFLRFLPYPHGNLLVTARVCQQLTWNTGFKVAKTCSLHKSQCTNPWVLWVKMEIEDNPVALGIILTFKCEARTSIPCCPVDHKDHNHFHFLW